MAFQVETISASQKQIDFVIPQADVARQVETAFQKVAARAQIPGFRRGKVPRKLLDDRYGDQIRQDVAADLMDYHFRLASQDVTFIGRPQVTTQGKVSNADFTFSVRVEVKPEVSATGYKGLEVDFPVVPVSDAQVDSAITARIQGMARFVDAEDGSQIAVGDMALCQIWEQNGDEWTQKEAGTLVNTKGDRYYPGLESLLIGAAKGEERVGEVGGKSLKVLVLGIQVTRLPDLDDDIATKLGFEGGVEGMKVAIRMDLEAKANEAARNQARVQILQKIVAANAVEVPESMIESHYQLLMEELKIQNTYRGRDARTLRYTEAQKADMRRRAAFAAQASIILDAVAKQEGIAVSDEDLDAKYQEIADQRGQRVEAIRGYFVKEGAVEELRKRILEERAIDWLLEQAELKTVEASEAPAEIEAPAEAPAEAAEAPAEAAE